jgi:hypothetical protein
VSKRLINIIPIWCRPTAAKYKLLRNQYRDATLRIDPNVNWIQFFRMMNPEKEEDLKKSDQIAFSKDNIECAMHLRKVHQGGARGAMYKGQAEKKNKSEMKKLDINDFIFKT